MKFRFPSKGISLCLLALQLVLPSLAQYSSDADYLLGDVAVSSAIPPFYENLDEKTYYHSRQIHGMKEDMNAHARNLRDLRMRFNQVFYGRKTSGGGEDPFQVGAPPQMPAQKEVSPKIVYVPPPPREPRVRYELPQADANIGDDSQMTPDEEINADNLLAFSVQAPGSYQSHDGQPVSPDTGIQVNAVTASPRRFDYYILTRVGLAAAAKITQFDNLYKRYKPGLSGSLTGGVRKDRWSLGLTALYQRNSLHSNSWAFLPKEPLAGDVVSSALLVEFSRRIPIYTSFSLDLGGALGYRQTTTSLVLSGNPVPAKTDNGFVWSAGTGLNWSFTEQASLLLAYRYFAAETVPTHNADLGLEFDF